jgi:hypothetical protein
VPEGRANTPFDQLRSGLHHFCSRARRREDVDPVHRFVADELEARIVHPPEDGSQFAPGYYSVLFEDPTESASRSTSSPGKDTSDLAAGSGPAVPAQPRVTETKGSTTDIGPPMEFIDGVGAIRRDVRRPISFTHLLT